MLICNDSEVNKPTDVPKGKGWKRDATAAKLSASHLNCYYSSYIAFMFLTHFSHAYITAESSPKPTRYSPYLWCGHVIQSAAADVAHFLTSSPGADRSAR